MDCEEIVSEEGRCTACEFCPMNVKGCKLESVPHSHGGAIQCPECGVPYYDTHPHSPWCSKGTPKVKLTCKDDVWYHFYETKEAWKG